MRILSSPRGPYFYKHVCMWGCMWVCTSDVLTRLATVWAARMCDLTASLPCWRFLLPWLSGSGSASGSGSGSGSGLGWPRLAQAGSGPGEGGDVLSDNDERPARLVLHHLRCVVSVGVSRGRVGEGSSIRASIRGECWGVWCWTARLRGRLQTYRSTCRDLAGVVSVRASRAGGDLLMAMVAGVIYRGEKQQAKTLQRLNWSGRGRVCCSAARWERARRWWGSARELQQHPPSKTFPAKPGVASGQTRAAQASRVAQLASVCLHCAAPRRP